MKSYFKNNLVFFALGFLLATLNPPSDWKKVSLDLFYMLVMTVLIVWRETK
jgi:glycopeptide antibiotics resistance protein